MRFYLILYSKRYNVSVTQLIHNLVNLTKNCMFITRSDHTVSHLYCPTTYSAPIWSLTAKETKVANSKITQQSTAHSHANALTFQNNTNNPDIQFYFQIQNKFSSPTLTALRQRHKTGTHQWMNYTCTDFTTGLQKRLWSDIIFSHMH